MSEGLGLCDLYSPVPSKNLWDSTLPKCLWTGQDEGRTDRHYLCLFSAILRISQVLVNLSDSSRVKPHSWSSDQARSGPTALANRRATVSTVIGEGPSLKLPSGDCCGAGFVLVFCTRRRRSFHSSTVSGIQPTQTHRNNVRSEHSACTQEKPFGKTFHRNINIWKDIISPPRHKAVFWICVE